MMEVAFLAILPYFVEVIHVELSDEGRVVAVFEVAGKDCLCEGLLVEDDKADS